MTACLQKGCCFDDGTNDNIPNCYLNIGCEDGTFYQDGTCMPCNCQQQCNKTSGLCSSTCDEGFIGVDCQADGQPFILNFTQDVERKSNSGQPTTFTCLLRGNVQTNVTMETESSTYFATFTSGGVHPKYIEEHTFGDVIITDEENVACFVTFSGGTRRTKEIVATAFGQPLLLTSPEITAIKKDNVTVNWNAWQSDVDIGDGPVVKYDVWYTKTSDDDFTAYPQDVNPSQTYLVVDGLSPYTEYRFAVQTYRPGVGGGGDLSPSAAQKTSCDLPLGSPTPIAANTRGTAEIQFSWEVKTTDLEPQSLQCDEVTSYTVHYRVNGSNREYGTTTTESGVTSVIITQLNPCTGYEVTVTMDNAVGVGPYSDQLSNTTLSSKPERVEDLSTFSMPYAIRSNWSQPTNIECPLEGYTLVYEQISEYNCGERITFVSVQLGLESQEHTILSLYPYTEYSVTVMAYNKDELGIEHRVTVMTQEGVPSAPLNLAVDGVSHKDLNATWHTPNCANGVIKSYTLYVWETDKEDTKYAEIITVNNNNNNNNNNNINKVLVTHTIRGLNSSTNYSLQKRKDMASKVYLFNNYFAGFSPVEEENPYVNITTEQDVPIMETAQEQVSMKPTIKPKPTPKPKPLVTTTATVALSKHGGAQRLAITIDDLLVYIKEKKQSGFEEEYKMLPSDDIASYSYAVTDDNTPKNRFRNILAYDHSRVVLGSNGDDSESDYINASYINGYKKDKAFIATQGPKPSTVNDLWRMVWQEKSACILMATNLVEKNKGKCTKYWPDQNDGETKYGNISVKNVNEEIFVYSVIRTFHVKKVGNARSREIKQFHFTVWPDMGVPQYPSAVLSILRRIRSYNPSNAGPVVVHCSAGVGRTGTFITIDAMLEMAEAEGKVDIFNFVHKARQNRMNFVQTLDQYEFIYTAVLEATVCGNTEIQTGDLRIKLGELKIKDSVTGISGIEREFRNLNAVCYLPNDDECLQGRVTENKNKNRYPDIVPIDRCRPLLTTPVENEGATNYINASFLTAYTRKDAFLATQMPMSHTIVDFWRMVYDYKTNTIVMLNDMDSEDMQNGQYWSDENVVHHGPFKIVAANAQNNGDVIERSIHLTLTTRTGLKMVRHITHLQLTAWPSGKDIPDSKAAMLQMITLVEKAQQQSGDNRITVHCSNGLGRSGVCCAVLAAYEKIKMEQIVNVFQAVKTLRDNRPQMVETLTQYQYIYDVLLAYLDSFATYANFE
ncbi:receptor-type tyrosine-protein phosphatase kappa-like [Glandiceps talaboti]